MRGRERSEVPRYAQIAARLREEIGQGRWRGGERLPPIAELAVRFSTTPVTARQAIKLLEGRGVVACRRGSGTYVTGSPLALQSLTVGADLADVAAHIEQGETRPLDPLDERRAPLTVPEGLEAAPAYRRFCRLSLRDEQPFMVSDVFLDRRILREHGAAFASGLVLPALLRLPGRAVRRAEQVLTIDMSNPPVAAHLRLPSHAAIARLAIVLRDRTTAIYVGALYWPADLVRVEFAT